MQREPENNQPTHGMAADGEFDDFASAMQGVQPLSPSKGKGKSKGKQTFAAPQRLSAEEVEARRRAAEEFQTEEDTTNFLTLG